MHLYITYNICYNSLYLRIHPDDPQSRTHEVSQFYCSSPFVLERYILLFYYRVFHKRVNYSNVYNSNNNNNYYVGSPLVLPSIFLSWRYSRIVSVHSASFWHVGDDCTETYYVINKVNRQHCRQTPCNVLRNIEWTAYRSNFSITMTHDRR